MSTFADLIPRASHSPRAEALGDAEVVSTEPPNFVEGVHSRAEHRFSKTSHTSIELLAGLGVAGDAHCGATIRHRSRVATDPLQPNLRQVHLMAGELPDELNRRGFTVRPGDLGENVTTRGIDLLSLATGSVLALATTRCSP